MPTPEKKKLIKSQFEINHPIHFFSVWNFKLRFPYLNFPKIDSEILVKFGFSLKSLNSLHIIILNGFVIMGISIFSTTELCTRYTLSFYKQETSIVQYTLKGKKYVKQ